MKLYTMIIYSLCICISFITYPCNSHQANEQGDNNKVVELTVPMLPRKLKVHEEAMVKYHSGKQEIVFDEPLFDDKQQDPSPGNMETREINRKKGSQEEFDEAKEEEYFTMDYRRVKKRRPIHNKSQPFSSVATNSP